MRKQRTTTIALGVLIWVTPAIIAGAFGWRSVWGDHNALLDYLFPLPFSGGVLHLPSFLLTSFALLLWRDGRSRPAWLPWVAAGVGLAALASMIDFERINAWLFTDYQPAASVLQFNRDAKALFIASDCLWLVALTLRAFPRPRWQAIVMPLLPLLVISIAVGGYQVQGPIFERHAGQAAELRGDHRYLVYTNQEYDVAVFEDWVLSGGVTPPWLDANAEHVAVLFTNSKQLAERGDYSALSADNIIATACWFEEDRELTVTAALFDCFADRQNTVERGNAAIAVQPRNLPDDIRRWLGGASICQGVSLDVSPEFNLALVDHCRTLRRRYPQAILAMKRNHGRDARVVRRVQQQARQLGFER
ncbi:MAG: hypothetical protein AAGJ86_04830 [Pseudomonadota bacterium]